MNVGYSHLNWPSTLNSHPSTICICESSAAAYDVHHVRRSLLRGSPICMDMGKSQKQATDDSDDGHETRKEVVKSTPTTNSLPVLYYPKFEPDQRWLRSVLLLVDEVVRIIPKDTGHADSLQTRKLSDEIPGCLKSISPTDNDIAVDFIKFNRLEKAFAQIRAKNRGRSPKNLRINIDGGRFRVEGNVWLSNSKLEPQIRELLIKYDLADMASPIAEMVPFENAILANEDASGLIVSHIADRIARRTGWDTMTDEPLPFVVRSLDALGFTDKSLDREGEGVLASTIANIVIPSAVEQLSIPQYQEIRESFEDVRRAFQELVRAVSTHANLNRAQTATALDNRLQRPIVEFCKQWVHYKESRTARKLMEWTPMCIGGLLAIPASLFNPLAGVALAAGGFTVTVIEKCMPKDEGPYGQRKAFDLLCRLEKQILREADIKSLI